MALVKQAQRDVVEDISEGCRNGKYCILKEIVLNSGMSDRLLVQLKCIEKFKFERSSWYGKDIGWEEAHKEWIKEGYSEKFRKLYHEGASFRDIYPLIMDGPEH
jgi:hypothetical protein